MAGLKQQFKEKRFVLFWRVVGGFEVEIGVVFLAQKAVPALSVHDMFAIKAVICNWAHIS